MIWTGVPVVGGGVSTFYFPDTATGYQAAVVDFAEALQALVPDTVGLRVEAIGDVIESTTGALTGSWSDGTLADNGGTNGSVFAQGVGARIVWDTLGFTNGRRVRGSTFICPIGSDQYEGDGTLSSGCRASLTAAAGAFISAPSSPHLIWHRPVGGSGGGASSVVSANVPDKISWLRSRRT